MEQSQLGYYADIIGIISGILSMIGVGGILSWSLFRRGQNPLSESVLKIFAYSLKTALCIFLFGLMYFFAIFFWVQATSLTGGDNTNSGFLASRNLPATIITALWFIPSYILLSVCIYKWSLRPLIDFWTIFKDQKIE